MSRCYNGRSRSQKIQRMDLESTSLTMMSSTNLCPFQERYYYFARDKLANESARDQTEDRKELVRIPTCAIFHKFASGKGVPHSFVGFIRQWPALPHVVVSLQKFHTHHWRTPH